MSPNDQTESLNRPEIKPPFTTPLTGTGVRYGLQLLKKRLGDKEEIIKAKRLANLLKPTQELNGLSKQELAGQHKNANTRWYSEVVNANFEGCLDCLQNSRAPMLDYEPQVLWTSK